MRSVDEDLPGGLKDDDELCPAKTAPLSQSVTSLTSHETSVSTVSQNSLCSLKGMSPLSSKSQLRGCRKRSHMQVSSEEIKRRRQRRLEKNRATAAISRERKRTQFADLQARVNKLEADNYEMSRELQDKTRHLQTVNDRLTTFAGGSKSCSAYQERKASLEIELIDMPQCLQPDAQLLSTKPQSQVQENCETSNDIFPVGPSGGYEPIPLDSTLAEAGRWNSFAQDHEII